MAQSSITTYPANSSSPIKSIQRGVSNNATSVTINAVDTTKSFVNTFPIASSGDSSVSANMTGGPYTASIGVSSSVNFGTSFTTTEYGAYLSTSTTLVTTGPCRWEIVEFL